MFRNLVSSTRFLEVLRGCQPQGIDSERRPVADILEQVHSVDVSCWVPLKEPSFADILIPLPVIIQPRFWIKPLPRVHIRVAHRAYSPDDRREVWTKHSLLAVAIILI